jgi:hypothetical protein
MLATNSRSHSTVLQRTVIDALASQHNLAIHRFRHTPTYPLLHSISITISFTLTFALLHSISFTLTLALLHSITISFTLTLALLHSISITYTCPETLAGKMMVEKKFNSDKDFRLAVIEGVRLQAAVHARASKTVKGKSFLFIIRIYLLLFLVLTSVTVHHFFPRLQSLSSHCLFNIPSPLPLSLSLSRSNTFSLSLTLSLSFLSIYLSLPLSHFLSLSHSLFSLSISLSHSLSLSFLSIYLSLSLPLYHFLSLPHSFLSIYLSIYLSHSLSSLSVSQQSASPAAKPFSDAHLRLTTSAEGQGQDVGGVEIVAIYSPFLLLNSPLF